ncbi:hypothetical protein M8J75_012491 [Diaphorina citri]|nr:hypothetical protein M8J75_012491 [Diaphorina citri]
MARACFIRSESNFISCKILRKLLTIFHYTGLVSLPGFYAMEQANRLHRLYKNLTHALCVLAMLSNMASTVIYSIKEQPEFLMKSIDNIGSLLLFVELYLNNLHLSELIALVHQVEKLTLHDPKVLKRCQRQEKIFFYTFITLLFASFASLFVESVIPLPQEEIDFLARIYDRKHPENRLPVNMWIFYIDTSDPAYFYYIYIFETYFLGLAFILGINLFTFCPIILIYLSGQYYILEKCLVQLGSTTNQENGLVHYTDLWNNKFIVLSSQCQSGKKGRTQSTVRQHALHDVLQIKQMVIFHQKLIELQRKVLAEVCLTACNYFYICIMSEVMESSNNGLRLAIYNSHWYNLCRPARQHVVMFLQRSQTPSHIRTFGGTVVLGYTHFTRVLRLEYNVVNFLKLKSIR